MAKTVVRYPAFLHMFHLHFLLGSGPWISPVVMSVAGGSVIKVLKW